MAKNTMYEVTQKKLTLSEEDVEQELSILPEEYMEGALEYAQEDPYTPDEDDEEILHELQREWQIADDSRPEDRMLELRYKQFVSYLHNRPDGLANTNNPIEFATIENKMADLMSQKPVITLLAQEPDDMKKVSLYETLWDFVWNEADTEKQLFMLHLCAEIFGTGFWYETMVRETYTRWEPVLEKDGKIGKKAVQETRSYLQGKALDIRNVWIDPVASIEDAEWVFISEVDLSWDYLRQLCYDPNYRKDALMEYLSTRKGGNYQGQGRTQTTFMTNEEKQRNDTNKFTLIHYYNKRKGLYIVTDEDFKFIFRYGANPYPHGELPISVLQDHLNYRSIYGRGECELLESTKYERNMIRNQLLDYVRFSNTLNIAVGSGITFEDQELVGSVARVWNFSGDLNQMQFLKPPSQDGGLFSVDEMLSKDATWITGIDNNALLGSPTGTAFEARLQEQQKLKRIYLSLRLYDFFLTRMGRQRLANIQYFMPYTTGKRLIGNKMSKYRTIALQNVEATPIMGVDDDGKPEEKGLRMNKKDGNVEFLELTPKMIKSNMDIMVTTPSTTPILRDLNRAEMQELLNMVMSMAQLQNNPKAQKFVADFDAEAYAAAVSEGIGVDMSDFMPDENEMTPQKQGDLMQSMMGDLPMPPKTTMQEMPQPMGAPMQGAEQLIPGIPTPQRGGAMPL